LSHAATHPPRVGFSRGRWEESSNEVLKSHRKSELKLKISFILVVNIKYFVENQAVSGNILKGF
jgi:hypothetical protein